MSESGQNLQVKEGKLRNRLDNYKDLRVEAERREEEEVMKRKSDGRIWRNSWLIK